jgi:hypothetical protein
MRSSIRLCGISADREQSVSQNTSLRESNNLNWTKDAGSPEKWIAVS